MVNIGPILFFALLIILTIGLIFLGYYWLVHNNTSNTNDTSDTSPQKVEDIENPADELYRMTLRIINEQSERDNNIYLIATRVFYFGLLVIIVGIVIGITLLISPEFRSRDKDTTLAFLPVIAGVLIDFISATIMVLYRAVNKQTLHYFSTLQNMADYHSRLENAKTLLEGLEGNTQTNTKSKVIMALITSEVTKDSSDSESNITPK